MNEHKRNEMKTWLARKAAEAGAEEKALMADDRKDEAVLSKIRGNVYDIFSSVLGAAEKICVNPEQLARFFGDKLDSIPQSWEESLAKARAHDEGEKAHIEEVKLAAAQEIRAKLKEVMA